MELCRTCHGSRSTRPTLVHHVLADKYKGYLSYLNRTDEARKSRRFKKILDLWTDIATELNTVQLLDGSNAAQNKFTPPQWKACHFTCTHTTN